MMQDSFTRPVTGGSVRVERLESGYWTKVADGVWTGDGSYSASVGSELPMGTFVRLLYSGDYSVAPSTGNALELTPLLLPPPPLILIPGPALWSPPPPAPAVALPIPTVKIKAVSGRSKLKVDVNPDRGSKSYVFQVQRKEADGSWRAVKSYETRGATETRTLNLRKGTYRVWVRPGYGFAEAYSPNEVTLKR